MLVSTVEHALRHLKSLWFLDLSDNHLIGHVPLEISTLTKLAWLDLSYNDLDGLITEELFDGLKSLKNIGLSDNRLKIVVGSDWIPPFRLKVANLASCHIGPLFPSWFKWQMGISHINISRGNIIDRLPDWFSNSLSNVEVLDISGNQIIGALPTNMETMSLSKLLLSSNNITANSLSGVIPWQLSNLEAMTKRKSMLRRIPSGGQLDTLYNNNPSMYDGNAGLCGDILKKKCPGNDASNDYGSYKDHYELLYLCFGLVIGFVLGLWVVFSTLLFKKSWRIAYFRLFDKPPLSSEAKATAAVAHRRPRLTVNGDGSRSCGRDKQVEHVTTSDWSKVLIRSTPVMGGASP
ncbi:hypothetical protein OsI_36507 [Oryza sativa Indica Group]|uniref:Uncharacterized protein n=1 Tax=Oryza sativa subsp. indica TaxID=39946 RepID=B8BL34_ORYSI|nr:hypothetical protein OsI_36507 [Oryza sativa Indica Group]